MSLTSYAGTPQPSLAWQFEGTTTDYVTGLTGTTTGSVTYGPGKYNQGMSVFNVVGTDSASNLVSYSVVLNSTNGFTVSVWTRVDVVKTGSYASMIGLSATTNTGGFFNFFDITENPGGTFGFYGQNQSGSGTVPVPFNTSTTPVLSGWYHVTTVFTNSTISMYVNGIASGSTTYANAFTTNTMYLGRSGQYSGHSYCGSYDDLRLFNTALTSTQVQSIYNQQGMPGRGVQVKTAPAYTVSDQSPSPLTLSTYGSATSNTNSPFGGTEGSIENLNYGIPSSVSKTNFSFWGSNCFIEFWMYLSGTNSGNPRIIERGNYPNSEYSVYMNASSGGYYLKFSYGLNFPFAFQFIPGTWNHFSFSYNYATQTLYGSINGSVAGGGTTAGITYSSGSSVNLYPSGGGYVIDISNLRVVTGAATLPYISNFTVPTTPLSNYPSGTTALLLRAVSPGITLTGTPLFSQLSPAATSSAVGAFSLRAVNGTSVKAVNVVPGGIFPPSAMTQTGTNSSTQTLGTGGKFQGSYTASSSSSAYGTEPACAFRLLDNGGYAPYIWQVSTYPAGGGTVSTPTTTTTGATNYNGEWLQFQTPFPINLTSYSAYMGFLSSFVLLGSTTGATSSWTLIDSQSGIVSTAVTKTGLNFVGYSYFRFVIITSTQAYPLISNVRFNGTVPSLTQAQFPPSAMTSAAVVSGGGLIFTQTLSGGFYAGQYVASCSRYDYGWSPIGAFDLTDSLPIWQVNSAYTTGKYTGATTTAGYGGEWIQLQVPSLVKITSYYINSVWTSDFVLLGSTDASTWTLIDTQTGLTNGQLKTITGLNPSYYSYYRFVITKSYTNVSYPGFNNIILYGSNTDFYADRLGNLLTAPVVGQALADWLGGATGYVTTWYDQSGAGNHATQTTAANQPIIQRATKGPGYATVWPGTAGPRLVYGTSSNIFDSTNYTVCVVAKRNATITGATYYTGSNGQAVQNQSLAVGYNTDTALRHSEYSYSNNGPTVPAYAGASEPVGYDFFAFSQTVSSGFREYSWRSGTQYTSSNNGLTLPLTNSGNATIGWAASASNGNSFNGEIYELLVFTKSLYDLDGTASINQIYQNQLSYTGT